MKYTIQIPNNDTAVDVLYDPETGNVEPLDFDVSGLHVQVAHPRKRDGTILVPLRQFLEVTAHDLYCTDREAQESMREGDAEAAADWRDER